MRLRLLAGLLAAVAARGAAPGLARGCALAREGQCGEAVPQLVRALDRLPVPASPDHERAAAWLCLGACQIQQGSGGAGEASFARALESDPAAWLDEHAWSDEARKRFEAVRRRRLAAGGGAEGFIEGRVVGDDAVWKKVAVVGGGVALAGVAVASRGGDGSTPATGVTPTTAAEPTTTTTSSTTTTTTIAIPPRTTPTTTSTSTTTTTTSTTTTSTTTTTTTTLAIPPPCLYTLSGAVEVPISGGGGTCEVATRDDCAWTARTDADWIDLAVASGRGDGAIRFRVQPNNGPPRTARVSLHDGTLGSCAVRQDGLTRSPEGTVSWSAYLAVPAARGRIVMDGALVGEQEEGPAAGLARASRGRRSQVAASLVSGRGLAGTWAFHLDPIVPGSLRVLHGEVAALFADGVAFHVAGYRGAQVRFEFTAAPLP